MSVPLVGAFAAPGQGDAVLPSQRRVLVIEDDEAIALLIQTILQEAGLMVDTARTGHEALELAAATTPDLVVLDLGLPGLYGTSVAVALRQAYRKLPIIVVSALPDRTVAEDAWGIQAQGYLTKPFEPDALERLVLRYIEVA